MRTETPVSVKLEDYRPYPFDIRSVQLDFDLDAQATTVRSRMDVARTAPGDMVLNGVALLLENVEINGNPVAPDDMVLDDETLILRDLPDTFVLEITVINAPDKNTALSGLYVSAGRLCTQCEADGFRRITYWPDRPDVMSRYRVRMTGNKGLYPILLSNGTPGASGDLDDGRHFAEWDDPHPKPSYLFALCAGDYDVFTDHFTTASGKPVDLAIHVDKGDAERAAYAMDALKRSMKWDEEVFGREYDLGVFNIVAVRDFNFGAMENKGLNVFNSAYVLADEASATDWDFEAIESIVAHEYFHNWTGNRITCRDWFQLCLKEGLTVFRDQEFSADMRSRPVQRIKDVIGLRGRQFAEDGGPLAHPVRPDAYASVDNLYTATVYEKGAELIRMLKTLIGEADFAKGIALYFERHDGDAATIEDFYACFEDATGRDLGHFRKWYSQPGTPALTVTEQWDDSAGKLRVNIAQSNPVTPGHTDPQPLEMPVRLAAFTREGEKIAEHQLVLNTRESAWEVDSPAGRPLVSVNRGFSAPVRIAHDISDADSLALAKIDDDAFNSWDIFQSLLNVDLLDIAYSGKPAPDAGLIDALGDAVEAAADDPAFAALLVRLPDVSELFQGQSPADPVALNTARNAARRALAARLADLRTRTLSAPSPAPFKPDAQQSGIRALRGAMIALTGCLDTADAGALLQRLYDDAPNMTEQLACLRAIGEHSGVQAPAFADFHAQWASNPLVVDKWFQVCAATVKDARAAEGLTEHASYDASNPNRVRAVASVFASQNPSAFHAEDGSGYAFVARIAEDADGRNPALAARLLTAFEQWRSLAQPARGKAGDILKALSEKSLSKNARDIVSRAIGKSES